MKKLLIFAIFLLGILFLISRFGNNIINFVDGNNVSSRDSEYVSQTVPSSTSVTTQTSTTTVPTITEISQKSEETLSIAPTVVNPVTTTRKEIQAVRPIVTVPNGSTAITEISIPIVTTPKVTTTPAPVPQSTSDNDFVKTTCADDVICNNYVYRTLDDRLQKAYKKIATSIQNFDQSIDVWEYKLSPDEFKTIFSYIIYNEPFLQHISTKCSYNGNPLRTVIPTYTESKQTVQNMKSQVDSVANKILSGITPDMSDYDKAIYLHDKIIEICDYDDKASYANTPYGCLVLRKAHCQGYSFTYKYLCSRVGIDCTNAIGFAEEAHMWNIQKINGKWYHTDVTWDDQRVSDSFRVPLHDYFNAFSNEIQSSREIYKDNPIPVTTNDSSENYYVKNGKYITNIEDIDGILYNEIIKMYQNNSKYVSVKAKNSDIYSVLLDTVKNSNKMFAICDMAAQDSGIQIKINKIVYLHDDKSNCLDICFE